MRSRILMRRIPVVLVFDAAGLIADESNGLHRFLREW
jgi:hypothetical protein